MVYIVVVELTITINANRRSFLVHSRVHFFNLFLLAVCEFFSPRFIVPLESLLSLLC